MAESKGFDCSPAADLLLCDEETKSFCFDDFDSVNDQSCQTNGEKGYGRSDSESEPFIPLPFLGEECIGWMVEREREHLPRNDYLMRLRSGDLDLSVRREALDWISKACAHHKFGEFCLHLAMNYFDRFISIYSLPKGKSWVIQLITVACLSLAAKMDEVNVPSLVDLQVGEPRFLFEAKTIQRMEMLVLSYLNWSVKPYTPFNFMEFYLREMNGGRLPSGPVITRSIRIILSTIKGVDFLEFKPSEIAAAAALCVLGDTRAVDIDKALSRFIQEKGRVVKCLELIQDLISISGTAPTTVATATTNVSYGAVASLSSSALLSSVPCSPNGVLDAACLSYKSDEHSSSHSKRRKLDQETAKDDDASS